MGAMESSNDELDDIADQIGESLGLRANQDELEILVEWIQRGQAKNILVLSGAGVSTGKLAVAYVPSLLLLLMIQVVVVACLTVLSGMRMYSYMCDRSVVSTALLLNHHGTSHLLTSSLSCRSFHSLSLS